jgi:hypothetical protein
MEGACESSGAFADRKSQAIRICILRHPDAEHSFRFLKAADLVFGHSAMEHVEVRDAKTGAAAAGGFAFPVIRVSGGVVQGECGSVRREFASGRRLEP